jgi:hypothetical protein
MITTRPSSPLGTWSAIARNSPLGEKRTWLTQPSGS